MLYGSAFIVILRFMAEGNKAIPYVCMNEKDCAYGYDKTVEQNMPAKLMEFYVRTLFVVKNTAGGNT